MTTCNPCAPAARTPGQPCVQPTCADMLCDSLTAYNAIRAGMMSGKAVVSVGFGEQRVQYAATAETAKFLIDEIRRLNMTCPSDSARAILGIGNGRPIETNYGQRRYW